MSLSLTNSGPDPLALLADRLDRPIPAIEAEGWRRWLLRLLPDYFRDDFAEHHELFWEWVWAMRPGVRPESFVAIWPRGGAKSTSSEAAVVNVGARQTRRYGLYVCETQDQADDHVSNVAAMLESRGVEEHYPRLATRALGKYGNSKGWRRNRLRTGAGFTLDALGLDTAARGVKLEDQRPDLLVLDDIDSESDTPATTEKKIRTITRRLMPAGSTDLAILAVQNLVHPNSVFSQLADGRADFLTNRIVSGPIPALRDIAYEQRDGSFVLVAGEPTWEGQNLAICQAQVDDWGLSAFLSEAQHDVEAPPGGIFDHLDFEHCTWDEVPDLIRIVVWVDPAVTDKDESDSQGIQADGLDANGRVYRLWSWEARTSPLDALCRAIRKAHELGAQHVGVETDQGGDTWDSVYREALAKVEAELTETAGKPVKLNLPFASDKAGAGHGSKVHRASQMLADYERGRFVHVLGTHQVLERALRRFPKTKPLDLTDASYWSWHDLCEPGQGAAFIQAWKHMAAKKASTDGTA